MKIDCRWNAQHTERVFLTLGILRLFWVGAVVHGSVTCNIKVGAIAEYPSNQPNQQVDWVTM
jgi:hypothetical protein